MGDTFGMTIEVISRPYNFDFFSKCVNLLLFFGYYLTIAVIWFVSFRYTIESRYFCYCITSLQFGVS